MTNLGKQLTAITNLATNANALINDIERSGINGIKRSDTLAMQSHVTATARTHLDELIHLLDSSIYNVPPSFAVQVIPLQRAINSVIEIAQEEVDHLAVIDDEMPPEQVEQRLVELERIEHTLQAARLSGEFLLVHLSRAFRDAQNMPRLNTPIDSTTS